jgi:hypothetical protein
VDELDADLDGGGEGNGQENPQCSIQNLMKMNSWEKENNFPGEASAGLIKPGARPNAVSASAPIRKSI